MKSLEQEIIRTKFYQRLTAVRERLVAHMKVNIQAYRAVVHSSPSIPPPNAQSRDRLPSPIPHPATGMPAPTDQTGSPLPQYQRQHSHTSTHSHAQSAIGGHRSGAGVYSIHDSTAHSQSDRRTGEPRPPSDSHTHASRAERQPFSQRQYPDFQDFQPPPTVNPIPPFASGNNPAFVDHRQGTHHAPSDISMSSLDAGFSRMSMSHSHTQNQTAMNANRSLPGSLPAFNIGDRVNALDAAQAQAGTQSVQENYNRDQNKWFTHWYNRQPSTVPPSTHPTPSLASQPQHV